MPPGTIPDPRQNQIERLFGIIKINEEYYAYNKENQRNIKRCMPFGFTIVRDFNIVELPEHQQFEWNGHDITHRCVIPPGWVQQALDDQGPITREIFNFLRGLQQNNQWPQYDSELPADSETIDSV